MNGRFRTALIIFFTALGQAVAAEPTCGGFFSINGPADRIGYRTRSSRLLLSPAMPWPKAHEGRVERAVSELGRFFAVQSQDSSERIELRTFEGAPVYSFGRRPGHYLDSVNATGRFGVFVDNTFQPQPAGLPLRRLLVVDLKDDRVVFPLSLFTDVDQPPAYQWVGDDKLVISDPDGLAVYRILPEASGDAVSERFHRRDFHFRLPLFARFAFDRDLSWFYFWAPYSLSGPRQIPVPPALLIESTDAPSALLSVKMEDQLAEEDRNRLDRPDLQAWDVVLSSGRNVALIIRRIGGDVLVYAHEIKTGNFSRFFSLPEFNDANAGNLLISLAPDETRFATLGLEYLSIYDFKNRGGPVLRVSRRAMGPGPVQAIRMVDRDRVLVQDDDGRTVLWKLEPWFERR